MKRIAVVCDSVVKLDLLGLEKEIEDLQTMGYRE